MNTNIFLVESPFQMLCAIEANEYFNSCESILIIKSVSDAKSNNLMLWLIDNYYNKWDNIIICNWQNPTLRDFFFMNLIRKIKKNYKINYIFVGYPETRNFQWFCEKLEHNDSFILDDGTRTLLLQNKYMYYKNYLQKTDNYYIKNINLVSLAQKIKNMLKLFSIHYIFGLKDTNRIKYNIFSCFNVKLNDQQSFIKNNFTYIKNRIKNFEILQGNVYFYGSPMYEVGIIDFNNEINFLKEIYKYYNDNNKKMIYIPHRGDSTKKIEEIQKFCDVKYSTSIAEIEPIINKQLPNEIATFFSTILFTLPKIYPIKKVVSFKFDERYILRGDSKESINEIYNQLKLENIQIKNLSRNKNA